MLPSKSTDNKQKNVKNFHTKRADPDQFFPDLAKLFQIYRDKKVRIQNTGAGTQ